MPISLVALAKELEIAPEAVTLHALDFDFEIPEDELIPDEIAKKIRDLELNDEIAQMDHELEEQIDREIVDSQQKKTAGQKKVVHKKKKEEPVQEEVVEVKKDDSGVIILSDYMSVRQLAIKISKPIPIVLVKLKQNGIVANLKEEIDYETAAIISEELGVKVKKEAQELSGEELFHGSLADLLADEEVEYLQERPPVVSVMGHVDHGKTSIIDYIKKTKLVEKEAGGITQSIGAYQVEQGGKSITFLDTPGHKAFTTMRARGARSTDIAILVVAATEGLKEQSLEAIHHGKEAKIPIIVAINKIDMEGANPDQIKGQLAENDLNPEDWGGDTPCIELSAKTGQGIDKLLETIEIVASLQDLKANPQRSAIATIIESRMDKYEGAMATVIVNTGTLKKGDAFVIYDQFGKIRLMKNYLGKPIDTAGPSMPVLLTGFKSLPNAGDLLQVMESEKVARRKSEEVAGIKHEDELSKRQKFSLATLKSRIAEGKLQQLKVIVKADSKGSLEAIKSECEKVKTEESVVKIVHSGVGEVSESDIMLGATGETIVIGFNISIPSRTKKIADKEGVEILSFDVIYHLTEKLEEIIQAKDNQLEEEINVGSLQIKEIFAANKKMAVVGGTILEGKIRKLCQVKIFREIDEEEKLIGKAKIESVQKGPESVNEIDDAGSDCGMKIVHSGLVFEVKDKIVLFTPKK